ncbi:MAG: hypothetical protein IPL08_12160 [Saprospiraceae bacterium]|nr:hypothetical protein [Saprospiraceae bacterium]
MRQQINQRKFNVFYNGGNVAKLTQEVASVTVTLWLPDAKLLISSNDAPFDQRRCNCHLVMLN